MRYFKMCILLKVAIAPSFVPLGSEAIVVDAFLVPWAPDQPYAMDHKNLASNYKILVH